MSNAWYLVRYPFVVHMTLSVSHTLLYIKCICKTSYILLQHRNKVNFFQKIHYKGWDWKLSQGGKWDHKVNSLESGKNTFMPRIWISHQQFSKWAYLQDTVLCKGSPRGSVDALVLLTTFGCDAVISWPASFCPKVVQCELDHTSLPCPALPGVDLLWEHTPHFTFRGSVETFLDVQWCANNITVRCCMMACEHLMKGETVWNCTYNHKQVDKFDMISVW